MEKYILQILESNNRVIVPEFGAFIVKQRNPLVIIFNEFLQYNDGMLVDFISRTEGISRDEAKDKVDDFIKQVNREIERGNTYVLPTLGIISKSATGKISVEKNEDGAKPVKRSAKAPVRKAGNDSPKESLKKPRATEPKTKAAAEPKKAAENKQDKKNVPVRENTTEKPTGDGPTTDQAVPPVPADVTLPTAEKTEIIESTPTDIEKETAPLQEKEPVKVVQEMRREYALKPAPAKARSNKKAINIIIWVLVFILVNGLLIGYFVYNKELSGLFGKKHEISEAAVMDDEEVLLPENTAPVEDPQLSGAADAESTPPAAMPAEKSLPEVKPLPSGTRFYVVAGVFRDEENAVKLVRNLRKKGYNSEKFGMIGNLHAVSYDVFDNRPDADRLLKKIQQDTDPEAWIRTVR